MRKIKLVIMAGGVGARFWPLSRRSNPKQFLPLFTEKSLIQLTVERLQPLVEPEDVYIVSNRRYRDNLLRMFPRIPEKNLLLEPMQRNTAPCIAFAAGVIARDDPEAVMVILPADHFIGDEKAFLQTIEEAVSLAVKRDLLVTMGIQPTRPETGYGYIQYSKKITGEAFQVKTFAEKPNLETARRFMESGDFLWNSGIFVWRTSVILKAMRSLLPQVFEVAEKIREGFDREDFVSFLEQVFQEAPNISIDYGIMEKAGNVAVIRARFPWSDVGSWEETYQMSEKDENANALQGPVVTVDAHGCMVRGSNRLIALVDVKDLVVVETEDAILITRRQSSQRVKEVVEYLEKKQERKYL